MQWKRIVSAVIAALVATAWPIASLVWLIASCMTAAPSPARLRFEIRRDDVLAATGVLVCRAP